METFPARPSPEALDSPAGELGLPPPVVSCILSLATVSPSALVTLETVFRQTHPAIEVVIAGPLKGQVANLTARWPELVVVEERRGKSAARNAAARAASGDYLLLLDDDMRLPPRLVAGCLAVSAGGFAAVAIPEVRPRRTASLVALAAELEAIVASSHPPIRAPRFVRRDLYLELGGIDERLDPIDEGDLRAKLDERNLAFGQVDEAIRLGAHSRLSVRLLGKFRRGRKVAPFRARHPGSEQFRQASRGAAYWQATAGHPVGARMALAALKALDLAALLAGRALTSGDDRRAGRRERCQRGFETEASSYETEFYEGTPGARAVAAAERRSVGDLLPPSAASTADLGSGGGRWSRLLHERYPQARVVSVDLSLPMLVRSRRRTAAAAAIRADMVALPLRDRAFDAVVSFRAMKYAADVRGALAEAARIVAPGGTLVVEFPSPTLGARALRCLPSGTRLGRYARGVTIVGERTVLEALSLAGLSVVSVEHLWALPTTVWKRVRRARTVRVLEAVEQLAPRSLARSMLVRARRSSGPANPST